MRISILISLFLLPWSAFSQVTEINLVGTKNYPPFAYTENEAFKGMLVEIVQAVDDQLPKYKINIQSAGMGDIRQMLASGEAAGFLGSYFALNEWPEVYPYSYPIFHEQMHIICDTNFFPGKSLAWPEDYAGAKLGVVRSYKGWLKYGARARDLGILNVIELPSPRVALKAVQNEVVDCILFEKTVFTALSKELIANAIIPSSHRLETKSEVSRISVHIAYSSQNLSGDDKKANFAKDFDAMFYKLLSNNELDTIYQRYGVSY